MATDKLRAQSVTGTAPDQGERRRRQATVALGLRPSWLPAMPASAPAREAISEVQDGSQEPGRQTASVRTASRSTAIEGIDTAVARRGQALPQQEQRGAATASPMVSRHIWDTGRKPTPDALPRGPMISRGESPLPAAGDDRARVAGRGEQLAAAMGLVRHSDLTSVVGRAAGRRLVREDEVRPRVHGSLVATLLSPTSSLGRLAEARVGSPPLVTAHDHPDELPAQGTDAPPGSTARPWATPSVGADPLLSNNDETIRALTSSPQFQEELARSIRTMNAKLGLTGH